MTCLVVVNFDWSIGNGMICLFAGFALKFLDFICNCLIPTPSITRDEKLKREYEQLALAGSDDEADADYD